jgi:hypothetical protein
MEIQAVSDRLSELEARYKAWAEPIDHAMESLSYRINRDGYTYADYKRDIGRIREAQLMLYDPYAEMNHLFDEWRPAYLRATDRERADLRAAVRERAAIPSALLGYVYRSATRLRAGAGEEALCHGLAAASLEDCCRDFRDTFLALADLYVTAEEMASNPVPSSNRWPSYPTARSLAGTSSPRRLCCASSMDMPW